MIRIRKSFTFVFGESEGDMEHPIGPSETVPDQTLSLKEILNRFVNGREIPSFQAVYSEEEFPDFSRMDLTELAEYKELNRQRIKDLEASIKRAREAEQAKKEAEDQKRQVQLPPAQPAGEPSPPAP